MTDSLQRRCHHRSRFQCFARFRALHAGPDDFERLCVTEDFSSDGVYFLALSDAVRLKMQLLLSFPYLADSAVVNRECVVEVVRTQSLFPGRCGVGARLVIGRSRANVQNRLIVSQESAPNPVDFPHIDLHA